MQLLVRKKLLRKLSMAEDGVEQVVEILHRIDVNFPFDGHEPPTSNRFDAGAQVTVDEAE